MNAETKVKHLALVFLAINCFAQNVTTNEPKPVTAIKPCLVVASEEHGIASATGIIAVFALAHNKGYFAYRDSYNVPSNELKLKYKRKELEKLMQSGIKVVVTDRNNKATVDAKISCQDQVVQK